MFNSAGASPSQTRGQIQVGVCEVGPQTWRNDLRGATRFEQFLDQSDEFRELKRLGEKTLVCRNGWGKIGTDQNAIGLLPP